jgi:hypothetical protein
MSSEPPFWHRWAVSHSDTVDGTLMRRKQMHETGDDMKRRERDEAI